MAHPTQKPVVEVCEWTPADLLRAAALYLQRHGWTQRRFYDDTTSDPFPPACAMGAITISAYGWPIPPALDDEPNSLTSWAEGILDGYLADYGHYGDVSSSATSVDAWNDHPGRTAEQVITVLRNAADDYDGTPTGGAR